MESFRTMTRCLFKSNNFKGGFLSHQGLAGAILYIGKMPETPGMMEFAANCVLGRVKRTACRILFLSSFPHPGGILPEQLCL